jgi:hypothetical protein
VRVWLRDAWSRRSGAVAGRGGSGAVPGELGGEGNLDEEAIGRSSQQAEPHSVSIRAGAASFFFSFFFFFFFFFFLRWRRCEEWHVEAVESGGC